MGPRGPRSSRAAVVTALVPLLAWGRPPARIGADALGPPARRWALPLCVPGVPNLHRVGPALYRGGQPTAEGFRGLARLGVKTVVSLRAFHSDERLLAGLGMGHERLRFQVWAPDDRELRRVLEIATDPARQPVFVHCLRGADRTGVAVAAYRVCVEGWSRQEALAEMTQGGFGFKPVWRHLTRYVRGLDCQRVRPRRPPTAPGEPSSTAGWTPGPL